MLSRLAVWIGLIGLVGLAGCQFDPSGLPAADPDPGARPDGGFMPVLDAGDENQGDPDAGAPPAPDCANTKKRWRTDFDENPTKLDDNDDGEDDWRFLGFGDFPEELEDDVWRANEFQSLHINPRDDFTGVTEAELRMRSVEVDPDSEDLGAAFWLSADTDLSSPGFTAVYVSLKLQADGTQTLRLVNALSNVSHVVLREVTGLGDGFVTVQLRVDVGASRVDLWVEGTYRGSVVYAPMRENHFAGVVAFGSRAEFDRVRVELCER